MYDACMPGHVCKAGNRTPRIIIIIITDEVCGVWGGPSSVGVGSGEGTTSSPENFWNFSLEMVRFGAIYACFSDGQ